MKKLFDPQKLDELVREVFSNMPPAFSELREECERNFRAGMESCLQKMNLVSREEYDVQTALLDKLRQRVRDLEQRLDRENAHKHDN